MSSFISKIMAPGGGVMLLPFVRMIIGFLLVLTLTAAIFDVARVHMIILTFLSAGLLVSLSFFESEYNKLRSARSGKTQNNNATQKTGTQQNKTD